MNASHPAALLVAPLLVLAVVLAGVLAACSARTEPEQPGTLTLELAANASTGFAWSYELSGEGVVEVVREEYVADKHKPDVAGYGGTQVYELSSVSDGTVAMRLQYARGSDEVAETDLRVFTVRDGAISEVTEPIEIEAFDYRRSATDASDARSLRAQREDGFCTVQVSQDDLGQSVEDENAPLSFMDALGKIAAACGIEGWDGLSETDADARDGASFQLDVTLADGSSIHASGSKAQPEGSGTFADMVDLLYRPYLDELQEGA